MVVVQKPMGWCQNSCYIQKRPRLDLDCKTVGFFFSKSVKKSVKRCVRVLSARSTRAAPARRACEAREKNRISIVSPHSRSLFSASFQTFCLTAHDYLNKQKYGLFCSLGSNRSNRTTRQYISIQRLDSLCFQLSERSRWKGKQKFPRQRKNNTNRAGGPGKPETEQQSFERWGISFIKFLDMKHAKMLFSFRTQYCNYTDSETALWLHLVF